MSFGYYYKTYKTLTLFIIIILGSQLLLRTSAGGYEYKFLLYGLMTFVVVYFIQSVQRIYNKFYWESLSKLLIFILIFIMVTKIIFEFYNIYFNILFSFIASVFLLAITKSAKLSRPPKIELLWFTIIGSMPIITSDKLILQYIHSEKISYRQLTWDDFKGDTKWTSKYDAEITHAIYYKINKTGSYYPVVAVNVMIPSESWVYANKKTTYLLKHEQGHFDITEHYLRVIYSEMHKFRKMSVFEIEKRINEIIDFEQMTNSIYDLDTEHGGNLKKQLEWNKKISGWLHK